MKTILSFLALALCSLLLPTGCSTNAGVSAGHGDHQHGVAVQGRADRTGVGVGAGAR